MLDTRSLLFVTPETCFVQLPDLHFCNCPLVSCVQPWALAMSDSALFFITLPSSTPHSLCLDTKPLFCREELFLATVNVNIMVIACKNKQKEN